MHLSFYKYSYIKSVLKSGNGFVEKLELWGEGKGCKKANCKAKVWQLQKIHFYRHVTHRITQKHWHKSANFLHQSHFLGQKKGQKGLF